MPRGVSRHAPTPHSPASPPTLPPPSPPASLPPLPPLLLPRRLPPELQSLPQPPQPRSPPPSHPDAGSQGWLAASLSPAGPPHPPPGPPPGLQPTLPPGPPPSRVVLLRNMVSDAEAGDPSLPVEIQAECARWGEVQAVRVFEGWGQAAADGAANVKIFVVFAQPSGAQSARAGLDQRWFGGRRVEATLYDQARFDRLDLSG